MESKPRYTPETIKVYPLDMEKLNADINEFFHKDGTRPTNIEYRAIGTLAIVRQPKLCVIDDEFIGHDISEKIIFYIFETETKPGGGKTHNALPTYETSISLRELEHFLKPEVTLAEFTKDRRGYNSRIRANEADWIRYFNKA